MNLANESVLVYYPSLGRIFGCKAGLLLSYLLAKQADPEGFIQLTQADLERETAFTRREQENACARLRDAGVLEERCVGLPAKVQYRIHYPELMQLILEHSHD